MKKVWIVWARNEFDNEPGYAIFSSERKAKDASKHMDCFITITKVLVDNYKPKED